MIAFWTGAGGWIVVMYGALNTIPHELEEAARIDGAGPITIALRLKLPLIRKWIAYMVILSFATGTQLFVEPQLVNQASLGLVPDTWSSNQLAYQLAFRYGDFNARRRHRGRPARDRPARRGADRDAHRAVQEGGLMRLAARGLRLVILAAFAVFFVMPVLWLILAPTKSDARARHQQPVLVRQLPPASPWPGSTSTPSATTSTAPGSATRCCTRSARRRSCW